MRLVTGVAKRAAYLMGCVYLWMSFWVPTARAEFSVPALTGPVVDGAGLLNGETKRGLNNLIRRLHESGGTQLQILTVSDLGGLSIEEASIKVTDHWRLGAKADDNGVLLMIAAKERRVRIEVGQGREGLLPDIIASRIIREVIVPNFRAGDANKAVTAAVFAILHYTDPDFFERQGLKAPRGGEANPKIVKKLELALFVLFLLMMLPGLLFRRRRRSLWGYGAGGFGGGWVGGGGFGGGFGGGGWSGGGGGFSGGGASGGW